MFFKKKTQCNAGYRRSDGRCVKKTISNETCKLDGKTYCNGTDTKLQPPIARAGGKRQLADEIIKQMKSHETYDEPFVGGGAVFYKKPLSKKSYINDKDKDVIKVHKSFKNGKGFDKCDMVPSKNRFDKIKKKSNKSACDVKYLNRLSFGSGGTSYPNKKFHKGSKIDNKYQKSHKQDYQEKLKNTNITSQDFKQVMKKADSKKTVHFLDPPYYEQDSMYKEKGVTPKDVCDMARKMKGQVIITYNDHPEVRKSCRGMKQRKISSRYTLSPNSNNKKSKELLIIKG